MADINDMSNWHGPLLTRADAIEAIRLMCGSGYDALLWTKGGTGKKQRWWINDGIDPDTGKKWTTMPKGGIASWTKIW